MPFGPVGVPTNMMVTVTKINALVMTRAIGIDMTICALIIPVFMLVVMAGWKKAMEVLPAAMVILGISPSRGVKVFAATCKQLRFALITLASVIGIGFVANYSGMSYTLGLTFATYTGMLFPIFSPIIGWLGVFLTGSVTSSAALFGKLQQVTAMQININPVLTTSANLFGGVMGKLISPQSIAVACAATGLVGREPDIFRKTIKYSVMLLGITIAVVLLQAYVVPGLVPRDTMALMP